MARIQDQTNYSRDQALTVLTWLCFARVTLSPLELQHALAIEPHTDVFDEDNVSNIESLISVCKGLVSVDQESEVVRLSHYTNPRVLRAIRQSVSGAWRENNCNRVLDLFIV